MRLLFAGVGRNGYGVLRVKLINIRSCCTMHICKLFVGDRESNPRSLLLHSNEGDYGNTHTHTPIHT